MPGGSVSPGWGEAKRGAPRGLTPQPTPLQRQPVAEAKRVLPAPPARCCRLGPGRRFPRQQLAVSPGVPPAARPPPRCRGSGRGEVTLHRGGCSEGSAEMAAGRGEPCGGRKPRCCCRASSPPRCRRSWCGGRCGNRRQRRLSPPAPAYLNRPSPLAAAGTLVHPPRLRDSRRRGPARPSATLTGPPRRGCVRLPPAGGPGRARLPRTRLPPPRAGGGGGERGALRRPRGLEAEEGARGCGDCGRAGAAVRL